MQQKKQGSKTKQKQNLEDVAFEKLRLTLRRFFENNRFDERMSNSLLLQIAVSVMGELIIDAEDGKKEAVIDAFMESVAAYIEKYQAEEER